MAPKSMAMSLAIFFFLFFYACVGLSSATVHTVGDAKGWTTWNAPNYTAWAAKETFHVGDMLLFVYSNKFHNVLEVMKSDYDTCTATSPIKKYDTGNDSITIATAGHHYFLCGVPTHCSQGQKFGLSTVEKSTEPTSPPAPSPNVASALAGRKGLGLAAFAVLALAYLALA